MVLLMCRKGLKGERSCFGIAAASFAVDDHRSCCSVGSLLLLLLLLLLLCPLCCWCCCARGERRRAFCGEGYVARRRGGCRKSASNDQRWLALPLAGEEEGDWRSGLGVVPKLATRKGCTGALVRTIFSASRRRSRVTPSRRFRVMVVCSCSLLLSRCCCCCCCCCRHRRQLSRDVVVLLLWCKCCWCASSSR